MIMKVRERKTKIRREDTKNKNKNNLDDTQNELMILKKNRTIVIKIQKKIFFNNIIFAIQTTFDRLLGDDDLIAAVLR